MISEKTLLKNVKRFGFESFDSSVHNKVNKYLKSFVSFHLTKALKKYKTEQKLTAEHLASIKGGRVLMPSQYFGVDNNSYQTDAPMGVDMTVIDKYIRPQIDISSKDFLQTGAAYKKKVAFEITQKAIRDSAKSILAKENKSLDSSAVLHLKLRFEEKMTKAFKKLCMVSRSQSTLEVKHVDNVVQGKQFSDLLK